MLRVPAFSKVRESATAWLTAGLCIIIVLAMQVGVSSPKLNEVRGVSCCTSEDLKIVQSQWNAVWKAESSEMKLYFARTLLLRLQYYFPEVGDVFERVDAAHPYSGNFTAHCMRIVNAFDMIINLLNSPRTLDEVLEHLAEQHAKRPGVRAKHMHAFGLILNLGLLQILDDYDAMAWKSCWKGVVKRLSSQLH